MVADWKGLYSDADTVYDKHLVLDVSDLAPMVTWGTTPAMGVSFDEVFPAIRDHNDERAYAYMDLAPSKRSRTFPLAMSS